LLGGRYRTHLPVSWVAYVRHSSVAPEGIEQKVAEGFRAFKLKVGSDIVIDCENVAAIRKIAGPEAYIKVDPSGTWNEEQAIENIRKMAEAGIDAVETPVDAASRDIAKNRPEVVNDNPGEAALALARVRRAVPVKIIEHVGDYADVFATALVRHRAVDIFNVIPSQTGSLSRARRLTEIAEAAGLKILLGSTVEMGIGTAAALHLGVASNAVTAPSDLIGPGHLEADVITPVFTYEAGGQLRVPEGPGLGVVLDEAQMEKHRA
jgi:muconate cycloisomerase